MTARTFFIILLLTALKSVGQSRYDAPSLEFIVRLDVEIGQPYSVGETPLGIRTIIPITGGTFEGPSMRGEVISGGADYQLTIADGNRTSLEAIYTIKTDDGYYIHVRNRGIISKLKNETGNDETYFMTSPQFEASIDSPYSWLNNGIFVCRPVFDRGEGISLLVWMVK